MHGLTHEAHLLPRVVSADAASGKSALVELHGHEFGKPIWGFRFR